MKKTLVLVVLAALLGGCASGGVKDTNKVADSSEQVSNQSKSQKSSSSTKQKGSSLRAISKSPIQVAAALWNAQKRAQLSALMNNWSAAHGWSIKDTADGQVADFAGVKFPEQVQKNALNMPVYWDKQRVHLSWSNTGEDSNTFRVVEAVVVQGEFPSLYLFCLNHRQPLVLTTGTVDGGELLLSEDADFEVQAGFYRIVTGKRLFQHNDSELNQDVSVAVQKQQMPVHYVGTWYYYSQFNKRIETTVLNSATLRDTKLTYFNTTNPKWLNLNGKDSTAGDGEFLYLRYIWFNGLQIPMMITASGAGEWFAGNMFKTPAAAEHFKGEFNYWDSEAGVSPAN